MDVLIRHLLVLVAVALMVLPAPSYADEDATKSSREYQIKAAFLFNFARFASWPADRFADDGSPVTLCILGADPFGPVIDATLSDKVVRGRSIIVRRLQRTDDVEACHLLFVSGSEQGRLAEIIASVSGLAILTVADGWDFAERGGIINLVIVGNKIRFEINPGAAGRANVQLSAQLLKLALIVGS